MNISSTQDIQRYLEEQRARVDEELERVLPGAGEYPAVIHQAMRYSVFAGGKRLRPILCLETGRVFGGDEKGLRVLGAALELIHTYSLIHDDLPALDNDDLRRGKPTCHRVFGEAMAILAGDALLTMAFEVISQSGLLRAEQQLRIVHELARAIGTRAGMVGGQVMDLETAGRPVEAGTLEYIHAAKTGSFIRAAVRLGALYARASEADLSNVSAYGEKVGLAFQIVDDLLDVLGSREALGKSVGKDDQQHKATYPALHGIEKSRQMAAQLIQEACESIQPYGERARTLEGIARYLIERES